LWLNRLIATLADLKTLLRYVLYYMSFYLPVVGHGIAVNDKLGRNGRLGCANITADSSLFVEKSLEYKKENDFSR